MRSSDLRSLRSFHADYLEEQRLLLYFGERTASCAYRATASFRGREGCNYPSTDSSQPRSPSVSRAISIWRSENCCLRLFHPYVARTTSGVASVRISLITQ